MHFTDNPLSSAQSAAPAAGHTEGPALNYNVKIYVLWLDIEGRSCVMRLTDLHPHTDSERDRVWTVKGDRYGAGWHTLT